VIPRVPTAKIRKGHSEKKIDSSKTTSESVSLHRCT